MPVLMYGSKIVVGRKIKHLGLLLCRLRTLLIYGYKEDRANCSGLNILEERRTLRFLKGYLKKMF